ncbi:NusG domain II-containing protein [Acidilutibacter cellobiosedens]|uniref:NusG domain II-containing protein n=1 Tax=Acidilutibacter cellobiosedens TaxID=2507161 RepID=A0A410QE66_9FIRM|nr:NusG domain II-containing protein [Acidilutibacter cellobiosedens]MBE6081251.1 NusG domain II-containing protein [Tissierellaceae bacterium]QAT62219.1 NusG domain II-containing protein [Acidilutibacter cellobiosedens]
MTKGDKYLIIIIIIISLISIIYVERDATSYNSKYISIQVNGKEYKKITFNPKMVGKTIPIKTKYGYNLIEIGDEKVRVIEADCPDKLDVKQRYISKPGETIVCLPNRLIIEIKGENGENEIDYLSY